MKTGDTTEHLKHTRGSTDVHGNENKVAQRAKMFKSMESWIESTVLPLLKPIEKSWQPHDFLPDSSLEDEEFFERVKELREMARELPDEYLVILVGAMITEEALLSYQMGINNLDAINGVTCCSPDPWARWLRGWSAEENRHARLAKHYGDKNLAQICGIIAADEKRHEAAYIKIVEKLFEVDPDYTILASADMMKKKISMPGRLMYDGYNDNLFANYSAVAQRLGIYTTNDYADVLDFLIKRWNVENSVDFQVKHKRLKIMFAI
ncbi:hypothetical protein Nepgr_028357 [Nepenthes gracilis]|uniref:Acyl-[acyl-carrier-protein] desaturase n=1 Tax=Nepenthes gracilis TaxID=150966 RepID=A0AAD3TC27_NEPGR|nr:hypothetical protein Nepgr_028357 [Nepenthes gracilis]